MLGVWAVSSLIACLDLSTNICPFGDGVFTGDFCFDIMYRNRDVGWVSMACPFSWFSVLATDLL